jgi:hypothetical protein
MDEQYIKIDGCGDKFYFKDREMTILHREDGPAIEEVSGSKFWCINDSLHREDGPAVEWADGLKEWYLKGKLHREDGPAVEYSDGSKRWYLNGKRHREDGPAIELVGGLKEWYLNGKQTMQTESIKLYHLVCFPSAWMEFSEMLYQKDKLDFEELRDSFGYFEFLKGGVLRGTFTDRKKLLQLLETSEHACCIAEGYYDYALIETHDANVLDGCNFLEDAEYWLKFDLKEQKYNRIPRPECLNQTMCFA